MPFGIKADDYGKINYAKDLESSGSDDGVAVFILIPIYFIFLILFLLTGFKKIIYFMLSLIFLIISLFSLFILPQVGSVFLTIFYDKNIWLFAITLIPFFEGTNVDSLIK